MTVYESVSDFYSNLSTLQLTRPRTYPPISPLGNSCQKGFELL